MSSDPKSTDDAMKEFDPIHNVPIDVTDSITHDEFVADAREGRVGIKVIRGEPITLVTGARKAIFNVMAMLYLIAPLLLVPPCAYHEHNWWLLAGIAVSWAASATTANSASVIFGGKTVGGTLLLACIVLWFTKGIHNYFSFFGLCALWGCVLF